MTLLASILLVALTRAEMIDRLRAPAVTQAEGFVRVYANCPADMRREYQSPVARFAADSVRPLAGKGGLPRFARPGVIVTLGDARTNDTRVIARAVTNDSGVVTRIRLPAPGYANLGLFRMEMIKAYCRAVEHVEVTTDEAVRRFRAADPRLRRADERAAFERWLVEGVGDDEENLKRLTAVVEPGVASRREVLLFASRLFLYPPCADQRFLGRYDALSFRDALRLAPSDRRIRLAAGLKCGEPAIFGCGRGDAMKRAAQAYAAFLLALAKGETDEDDLLALLDAADADLNLALEQAPL